MSSFRELTKVDSVRGQEASFLLRWRGKQEGPYPASMVEAKLAANEIGLLHEILYESKWITLRDFIAAREAILEKERIAREEQRRRLKEEADRQARELEERLASHLLELANLNHSRNRTAVSAEVRREVWRRDQGQCVKCGSQENLEYDHVIPFSKGGNNTARNIQLLCEQCNRSKSDSIE